MTEQLWGGETTKAVENFPVSGERVPAPVVRWLGRLKAAAARVNGELGELDGESGWDSEAWRAAADPYWDEYGDLGIGPDARAPSMLSIDERGDAWVLTQVLDDPAGDRDWRLVAVVDIARSAETGEPVLTVDSLAPATG